MSDIADSRAGSGEERAVATPPSRWMPFSLWLIILGVCAGLFTLVPFVGQIFGLLMGTLLAGALINAGFAGIAVEAVISRLSRWWLVIPIGWFGFYAFLVSSNWQDAAREDARWRAANSAQVQFDPARHSLVIVNEDGDSSRTAELLERYNLPEIYEAVGPRRERFVMRIGDRATCATQTPVPRLRRRPFGNGGILTERADPLPDGRCIYSLPATPPHPEFRVVVGNARDSARSDWLPATNMVRVSLLPPDGPGAGMQAGTVGTLTVVPLLNIGCIPNLERGSPICQVGFLSMRPMRIATEPSGMVDPVSMIARGLGLVAAPGVQGRAQASAD